MANHDNLAKAFFGINSWPDGTHWRTVVDDFVDHLIDHGCCFSSGEIARWLRSNMPDLVFSVTGLGEHIRDLFYAGGLSNYPDDGYGQPAYPTQVPRTTQGLGRTPGGIQVFVYCPEAGIGLDHEFEVDIPKPGGAPTAYPTVPTGGIPAGNVTSMAGTSPSPKGVKISGRDTPLVGMKARVNTDRRLCVPRAAFEAFVHFTKQPMRGGDSVYVTVEPGKVTVVMDDPNDGKAKPYDLSTAKGRVLVPSPSNPFTPGDTYLVNIAPSGLTVDLTVKV